MTLGQKDTILVPVISVPFLCIANPNSLSTAEVSISREAEAKNKQLINYTAT